MWEKIKAALAWLYNWITVIGAVVVGSATFILPYLDTLGAVNFAAVLPPDVALAVVTSIGFIKWACVVATAVYNTRNVR